MKRILEIFVISIIIWSCEGTDSVFIEEEPEDPTTCDNRVVTSNLYYEIGTSRYLWGGEDSSTHFNINNWSLNVCNLKKGLGREKLYAPTEPEYELLSSTSVNYSDDSRAVVVESSSSVKVYPFAVLRRYETINEVVDGEPIAIVYCFLANDLASVYYREICGETLTFAVSGYTYRDPDAYGGLESFVLWDRNSESLWWPINDKGVSGLYMDADLEKYNFSKWGVSTFSEIRNRYDDAQVLKSVQPIKNPGQIRRVTGC